MICTKVREHRTGEIQRNRFDLMQQIDVGHCRVYSCSIMQLYFEMWLHLPLCCFAWWVHGGSMSHCLSTTHASLVRIYQGSAKMAQNLINGGHGGHTSSYAHTLRIMNKGLTAHNKFHNKFHIRLHSQSDSQFDSQFDSHWFHSLPAEVHCDVPASRW